MSEKPKNQKRSVQIINRVDADGFLMNVPTFLRISDTKRIHGPIQNHGGLTYVRVPSVGKYVTQVNIRIAAATPAEMEKHIDAFNKWADRTPLN